MILTDFLSEIEVVEITSDVNLKRSITPRTEANDETDGLYFVYLNESGAYSINVRDLKDDDVVITDRKELRRNNTIYVKNARRAMAIAFSHYYGVNQTKLKIIGITGTNGKTTTATVIYKALLNMGEKAGFIGTGKILSNERLLTDTKYSMTTPPPSILYEALMTMKKDGCEYCVMEVSSHALKQSRVDGINFSIGVFLNLSEEHGDYHSNMNDYYNAKMRLFTLCEKAIFNVDDEYGKRAYSEYKGHRRSFGIIERGDTRLINIETKGLFGSSFYMLTNGAITKIKTKLPTLYNIYNVGIASCVLASLGFKLCKIKTAIFDVDKLEGRMEVIHKRPTIIIDYAHTPVAVSNLVNYLYSQLNTRQRLIIVFGCGGKRDSNKRSKIGKIVVSKAHLAIITEDNSRGEPLDNIISDIKREISEYDNYTVIKDREAAIKYALENAAQNDIVVILGKGHEKYIDRGNGIIDFDETEIVRNYYKQ